MTLLRVYNQNGHGLEKNDTGYRFSDLMQDFFGDAVNAGFTTPKVNIAEDNENFTLMMALPGVKKSELNINIEKDELTISRTGEETVEKDRNYTRREFDYGRFDRSFNLPETVNVNKIKASMENGILEVVLPKKDEAIDKGPVQIKIS